MEAGEAVTDAPNAEQIEYWNEVSGEKWVALQEVLDAQIGPFGRAAMDRVGVEAGNAVIDVGCGCGDTTLTLAERVGPRGRVTGLDLSGPMLARARARARDGGVSNVEFVQADAQTHRFERGPYDVLFSRFGVMFFADPTAAFSNLRRALAPRARLGFVCWQAIRLNPWMLVPTLAMASEVELPPPPAPGSPGPFSLDDDDRIRGILRSAGFEQIEIEPLEQQIAIAGGADLEAAVDLTMKLGPVGRLMAGAEADLRERVRDSIRGALLPYETAAGVCLDAAASVVTARNPAK